jgi:hypothetical protein
MVVRSLIQSAVINWRPGKFLKKILMIQSHERNIKPFRAASSIRQQQQTPATAGRKPHVRQQHQGRQQQQYRHQ